MLLIAQSNYAQCAGGQPAGTTAFDTTISFSTGITSTQLKFPKFNPQSGMLSCVKLIVTIVGIVDTVAMQNYSLSPQTADFYYDRSDFMSGPGLTPSLSNSFNGHYGPYGLSAYDGTPNSGGDFHSIPKDTVLRKVMTRTLTDSTEISQFYGSDSVTYNYNINVTTSASITGGSSSSLVLTSAFVNFRFEYCTCPLATLPLGLRNFVVTKNDENNAKLYWDAEQGNDHYYYEIEVSRDGNHFTKAGTLDKLYNTTNPSYKYGFQIKPNEYGKYYFRVKQLWLDGYYRYTDIKSAEFSNPLFSTVSLYPNPSQGIVGIKFVTAKAGSYLVEITNAKGQLVKTNEIKIAATDYKVVATLQKGLYYVKLTDLQSKASCIKQTLIQ